MSKTSEAVKRWRKNTKERMVKSMGGKCCICGYHKSQRGMDFHHLDPSQKEHSFGKLRGDIRGWKTIVEELRKCVLVCCRCHAEIHDDECDTNVPKEAVRFDEKYADYKALEKFEDLEPCPVCGINKPKRQTTCSYSCAATLAGKIDWSTINAMEITKDNGSYEAAGRHLGITGAAVRKAYKKLEKRIVKEGGFMFSHNEVMEYAAKNNCNTEKSKEGLMYQTLDDWRKDKTADSFNGYIKLKFYEIFEDEIRNTKQQPT